MSKKKDPNDYQYGKPCEDHLGNFTWRAPHRNMGIGLTEAQKRRYKDYEEIPGSRYELEFKKRRKMTLEEKI